VYWEIEEGEVLVLNETTAKYSMVKFPEEIWGSYVDLGSSVARMAFCVSSVS
jgi:hypothetical protein